MQARPALHIVVLLSQGLGDVAELAAELFGHCHASNVMPAQGCTMEPLPGGRRG
jgi:hypothetical protein